ncbi:MAG: FAD-dependent oxidoreductase [Deltaproteobacteria bacterium]
MGSEEGECDTISGEEGTPGRRKHDQEGQITLVTEESVPFYYRLRLNELVSGDVSEDQLIAKKDSWYEDRGIHVQLGKRIVEGGPAAGAVITQDNQRIMYDRLLIATGSHSFIPPIKGADRKGVFALRSIQDARDIVGWAKGIDRVVLIGGGLLGLEAGNALRKLGKRVMVVEFFPRLLPRQLDIDGAQRLQTMMEGMGFSFRLGATTREIAGDDQAAGVILEGEETLPAQMVIISAGVRPNLEMAEALKLDYDKGIKVDERMRTNQPGIYAAGDVAEFKGIPYGIWMAAMEQG